MIRVNQIKLPIKHTEADLKKKLAKKLRVPEDKIINIKIVRQSLDARHKNELMFIYSVDVTVNGSEKRILQAAGKSNDIMMSKAEPYRLPKPGDEHLTNRPVIIGFGPAGMFAGLMLAKAGYKPLILERGLKVEDRTKIVTDYWNGGALNLKTNVQFGEGGAGTFSDGKLNTLVKDPSGKNQEVLRILAEMGADPKITYVNKPHVGTDVLAEVVKNIRCEIERLGGEILFGCKLTDVGIKDGKVHSLTAELDLPEKKMLHIDTEVCVLAVGHSARDTFEMLSKKNLDMQPKAFAVGIRIQHPQKMINLSQYGMEEPGILGAASYKLTHQASNGRGIYSFCMCPGGYVVDASSEEGGIAVNGMSYQGRDGANANTALIVTVTPEDFPDQTALGGVAFQRQLEKAAFRAGLGHIPVQLYGDFKKRLISKDFGDVAPQFKGLTTMADLNTIMPGFMSQALTEGIERFGEIINGYSRYDAIMAGIESRTSSPLKIPRNSQMESLISGIYPCGEGAGYAGGITSAAMDGMRVAEEIIKKYSVI